MAVTRLRHSLLSLNRWSERWHQQVSCPADATACEQPSSTAKNCRRCKPHSIGARRVRWDAALLLCILCGPEDLRRGALIMLYSNCRYNVMVLLFGNASHITSLRGSPSS